MVTPVPNYLIFQPDQPVSFRVTGARQEDRDITDPVTRQTKRVNAVVLEIADVQPPSPATTASFLSAKAQNSLAALINSGAIFQRRLEVIRRRGGYATEYEIRQL